MLEESYLDSRNSKGQVTERPKVAVLKTDVSKGTVGSNPTLPAKVLVVMFYGTVAEWPKAAGC